MEELVIRDADVVDGSGAPAYRADVVIDGGRIVSIVREAAAAGCQRPKARRELDAEGLVLSPASSTCTPTATWPCSATRTTAPRPRRV